MKNTNNNNVAKFQNVQLTVNAQVEVKGGSIVATDMVEF